MSSRNCTSTNQCKSLTSLFVSTDPFAVMTVVVRIDTRTVSMSAEFKSFSLSMCIDAPESATNSLSSDLIVDGAGRHQSNEGEKNVALFCSRSPRILYTCFAESLLLFFFTSFGETFSDWCVPLSQVEPRVSSAFFQYRFE